MHAETNTHTTQDDSALEDQFRAWVGSLSLLDQQFLRDHAQDATVPDKVRDLFRFSGIRYDGWTTPETAYSFYPEPLLRVLS